jgi:hypothetical protein
MSDMAGAARAVFFDFVAWRGRHSSRFTGAGIFLPRHVGFRHANPL